MDMKGFGQPQAGAVVETEEQSTLASELELPPKRQISTEYRPVTLPSHKLPRVTRREPIPTVQAPRSQYSGGVLHPGCPICSSYTWLLNAVCNRSDSCGCPV